MSSKIAALAEDPGQARVLFSNCYRDYAQTSAQPPASKRTNWLLGIRRESCRQVRPNHSTSWPQAQDSRQMPTAGVSVRGRGCSE